MLSELIFGKKLNEITLDDLKEFFSQEQEETSLLELKSGGVLIDDIYKEVCAFLNTEGGVLIIGTPREQKRKPNNKTEITVCQGELIPTNFRGKDWLMTSIVSNISPPPSNIKIQEFHTDNGSHFIVEVPQSMTPPHQSNRDSRYYIRMERDARPAPHGVVEALFFRRQKAELNIGIGFSESDTTEIPLQIEITNKSPYPTEKVSCIVEVIHAKALVNIGSNDYKNKIDEKDENTFSNNHSSEGVLWEGLKLLYNYRITPIDFLRSMPFIVTVTAWSRDATLTRVAYAFDPYTFEFILEENSKEMNFEEIQDYIIRLSEYVSNPANFKL